MNRQRRDDGEKPPKFPSKPVDKPVFPPGYYGQGKGKQK